MRLLHSTNLRDFRLAARIQAFQLEVQLTNGVQPTIEGIVLPGKRPPISGDLHRRRVLLYFGLSSLQPPTWSLLSSSLMLLRMNYPQALRYASRSWSKQLSLDGGSTYERTVLLLSFVFFAQYRDFCNCTFPFVRKNLLRVVPACASLSPYGTIFIDDPLKAYYVCLISRQINHHTKFYANTFYYLHKTLPPRQPPRCLSVATERLSLFRTQEQLMSTITNALRNHEDSGVGITFDWLCLLCSSVL